MVCGSLQLAISQALPFLHILTKKNIGDTIKYNSTKMITHNKQFVSTASKSPAPVIRQQAVEQVWQLVMEMTTKNPPIQNTSSAVGQPVTHLI